MKDKLDLIKESAENDLSVFIKLVAPHLMLGAIHEELIQWWTRSEGKNNQLVLLPRGHLRKLSAYHRHDGMRRRQRGQSPARELHGERQTRKSELLAQDLH